MAEVEFLIDIVDEADEKDKTDKEIKIQLFKDLDRYIVLREMMTFEIKKAYLKYLISE